MFKMGNFETELAKSMAENLSSKKLEKQASLDKMARTIKLNKAVDHLNAAADIFDGAGLNKTSETITRILETLANHKHKEVEQEDLPEVFEIESLLHDEPKDGEDDLGEQVIEMRSIATGKKKV